MSSETLGSSLTGSLTRLRDEASKGITFIQGSAKERYLPYAELYAEAQRKLRVLRAHKIRRGAEIVLSVEDNFAFVTAFWACLYGGLIPVPVTIGSQKKKCFNIWGILNDPYLSATEAELNGLQACSQGKEEEPTFSSMRAKRIDWSLDPGPDDSAAQVLLHNANDIAYIQFSSGSTGAPKGVILTHGNILANASDIARRSCITADDSMLSWMPLSHDMGLICFHLTGVVAGVQQHILPTSLFIRRPLLWLDKASEHKATLLYSPNFGYRYVLAALKGVPDHGWDLSAVRLIYNGAEPISVRTCRMFIETLNTYGLTETVLFPGYGLAEASVAVSLPMPGDALSSVSLYRDQLSVGDSVEEKMEGVEFAEVGYCLDNCVVRICNGTDMPLPNGCVGHIQIKGDNVTKGYYNNPGATAELFTADGWLRTGDLGFMREGRLVITGRAKSIIIKNGQNYYPTDLETLVEDGCGFEAGHVAACSALRRDGNEEELLFFILFKGDIETFCDHVLTVRKCVQDQTSLLVDHVIPVRKIPKTTSGKFQRFILAEQYLSGAYDTVIDDIGERLHKRPGLVSRSTEDILAEIFHSLYPGLLTDPHQTFISSGLDSLGLTRLVVYIQERLHGGVRLHHVLENPTLSSLARCIDDGKLTGWSSRPTAAPTQFHLTPGQLRMWQLHQAFPDNPVVNLTAASKIRGGLDVGALERAINHLTLRHPALRLIFHDDGEAPKQSVVDIKYFKVPFTFHDKRNLFHSDTELNAAVRRALEINFDILHGPLFKVAVWWIGPNEHLLLFSIHHIIFDGWSFDVLQKELSALYENYTTGAKNTLPEEVAGFPAVIDKDFAQLQVVEATQYWSRLVSSVQSRYHLPFAKTIDPPPTFTGHTVSRVIDRSLWRNVRTFSKQKNLTEFTTLVSALYLLLYKHNGSTDIVIGTELSGRDRPYCAHAIGHFINTVLLKPNLHEADSFEELLRSMSEKVLRAFEYQDFLFDLIPSLDSRKKTGKLPVADVFVILQNFESGLMFSDLGRSLEVSPMSVESDKSLFDLQFEFNVLKEDLVLRVSYNTDMYDRADMEQTIERFESLLMLVIASPWQRISAFELATGAEKRQIQAWSVGNVVHREIRSLLHLFEISVSRTPDTVAVVCDDVHLTYAALDQIVGDLSTTIVEACGLHSGNMQGNKRIGMLMPRSAGCIVSLLAILRSGHAYVPIDADYPIERIKALLADAEPRLLLTTRLLATMVGAQVPTLLIDEAASDTSHASPTIDPEEICYVMYTSGSTGRPKGVEIFQSSAADYVQSFSEYFQLASHDVVVQQSPFSFDTSVEEIFPVLACSGKLVLSSAGGVDAEHLARILNKEKITLISSTPALLKQLSRMRRPGDWPALRTVISGGDELRVEDVDRLFATSRLYNTYGPTETTVCATYFPLERGSQTIAIGRPLTNRVVYILDKFSQLSPVGVTGEIFIGGEGVAKGYLHNAEASERAFVTSPFNKMERIYRTGDRGKWLPDGNIQFEGRADDQIKHNGYRIELSEIRQALLAHRSVIDAEVLAPMSGDRQKVIHAYFVASGPISEEEIKAFLGARLPYYMLPAHVVQVDQFKLLPNGKRDLRSLQGIVAPDKQDVPRDSVEETLLVLWNEILETRDLSPQSNFFDAGGNSLKAMQIIGRVGKHFQTRIDLLTLFVHPTVRALAWFIRSTSCKHVAGIMAIEEQEHYAVSNSQQRLYFLEELNADAPTANNLFWAYELHGEVDPDRLLGCFASLVARYEILRTGFSFQGAALRQIVCEERSLPQFFTYIGLDDYDNLEALIDEEKNKRFDLDEPPLLRVTLVHSGAQKHILLVSIHHMVTDAWSVKIICNEIYQQYEAGGPIHEQGLRLQYKDYCAWLQKYFVGDESLSDRRFWSAQLEKSYPAVSFAKKGPHFKDDHGTYLIVDLEQSLVERIRQATRAMDVTNNMLLTALISVLYYCRSGHTQMVVGTTAALRSQFEMEDQIGFFVNTLPLHIFIDPEKVFRQFLIDIKSLTAETLNHQLYPFEKILELTGKNPIRTIVSGLGMGDVRAQFKLPGIEVRHGGHEFEWRHDFEVTCALEEIDGSLKLFFLYNTRFLNADDVSEIASQVSWLGRRALHNPGLLPGELKTAFTGEHGLGSLTANKLEDLLGQYLN